MIIACFRPNFVYSVQEVMHGKSESWAKLVSDKKLSRTSRRQHSFLVFRWTVDPVKSVALPDRDNMG